MGHRQDYFTTKLPPPERPSGLIDAAGALGDLATSVAEAVESFMAAVAPATPPMGMPMPYMQPLGQWPGVPMRPRRDYAPGYGGKGHGRGHRGRDHDYGHYPGHDDHDYDHDHDDDHDHGHDCGCGRGHHKHGDGRHHGRHDHKHGHDCGCDPCPECRRDDCHCDCCVCDADLVVYSRFGELRVIPVHVENERRREREITLELSEFTTRGGRPAPVRGVLFPPTKFTLEPCGHQDVIMVTLPRQLDDGPDPISRLATRGDDGSDDDREGDDVRPIPDVDDCTVAYADLRIEGCDIRPIRIAVALLPRDCGAFEVHCGCGCC